MAKGLTTYRAKIKKLAKLRKDNEDHAVLRANYQEALEKSAVYGKVVTAQALGKQKIEAINSLVLEIKELGVKLYDEGTREFPGSRTKEFSTMEYKEDDAIKWAVDHKHPKLLSLKKSKFKKIAKELDLKFVLFGKEIRIEIDSVLSMFLPKKDQE